MSTSTKKSLFPRVGSSVSLKFGRKKNQRAVTSKSRNAKGINQTTSGDSEDSIFSNLDQVRAADKKNENLLFDSDKSSEAAQYSAALDNYRPPDINNDGDIDHDNLQSIIRSMSRDGSIGISRSKDASESHITGSTSFASGTNHQSFDMGSSHDGEGSELKDMRKARFRGFSTSIQSLFLDEQIVCGVLSCFGVLVSSRTEHLLEQRQSLRGKARRRSPSRILGVTLSICIFLTIVTYVIWGFGNDSSAIDNYNDDQQRRFLIRPKKFEKKDKHHSYIGFVKIQDYEDWIWKPVYNLYVREYSNRIMEKNQQNAQRSLEDATFDNYYSNNDDASNYYNSNNKSSWTSSKEFASLLRMVLAISFLTILGVVGRRRRMRTRFALLKARTQEDKLQMGNNLSPRVASLLNLRQGHEDKYDGACSHTLCGCYPVDPPSGEEPTDDIHKRGDVIQRLMHLVSCTCCGFICKFWLQCFSVCALAQEAREIRLLVPIRHQRIDFITHQPFVDYYKNIYALRKDWKQQNKKAKNEHGRWSATKIRFTTHFRAMSQLSKILLVFFLAAVIIIILTERLNPRAIFSWADALVLIFTFIQSFAVIFIVHGIFYKSDLSLDAVIKFFATGFLIGMPTAFVFEGMLMNFLILIFYSFYFPIASIFGQAFETWVDQNFRVIYMTMEVIVAFLVASSVEEFCKYYSFRTVEHPDLLFLTGLDRSNRSDDKDFDAGGMAAYPFSSHNASLAASRNGSFDSISSYHIGRSFSSRSHRGRSNKSILPTRKKDKTIIEEEDVRTVREQAAAITTAMVSCAVGFACAENFIYVFFVDNDSRRKTLEELAVLIFRSIFPVHALSAALQSIGLVRKFLEKDHQSMSMGVGKIVLPAIILHGSFDAVLLLVNAYIETSWEMYYNGQVDLPDDSNYPYNAFAVNTIATFSVVVIMILATLWYMKQRQNQHSRLKLLERQISSGEANNGEQDKNIDDGYKSPSLTTGDRNNLSCNEIV